MAGRSEEPERGDEGGEAPIALRPGHHRIIAALVGVALLLALVLWRCG